MRILIGRSKVSGRAIAPSSKSYTIRGLMCAALAKGKSVLYSPLKSDDTDAAIDVLEKISVDIEQKTDLWSISGGCFCQPDSDLNCRESAATLRFMTAIASVIPGKSRITSSIFLSRRPIEPLIEALRQLGIACQYEAGNNVISVKGGNVDGGSVFLPGNISSQYVSALLLVGPLFENGITINLTTPLESKPYVEMTIECLRAFGIEVDASRDFTEFTVPKQQYRPAAYVIEGDWSSASYLLALGALTGEIAIENLNSQSLQGDKAMLDCLRKMGANITVDKNIITVRKSNLSGINVDLIDCIDLLPTIAVLAAMAEGKSELTGIVRARLKESDRVLSVKQELTKAGVTVRETTDCLTIVGTKPGGGQFDSHGDHRIAMALSLIGVMAGNTIISGAECVSKTYPSFWQELGRLGAKVEIYGE
jgi:3-phosphoshikimate 1-carboxyvinyltransferase